jgi:hypothetical protein
MTIDAQCAQYLSSTRVLFFTRLKPGISLCMCGRRDESLQIFSQACMFGAKLVSVGKEALPRVVLSAVLTGDFPRPRVSF